MRYIHHEAIVVPPDRQRREFPIEAHQELVDSIVSKGLLHAPVLRVVGDSYHLVAGERRLRAICDIHDLGQAFRYNGEPVLPGMVPYVLISDLTDLEIEEAELEENIRRVDLSWQERSAATARLAHLRALQAAAAGRPPPSVADIAAEVRGPDIKFQDSTRQEILLAKHLDRPEVANAKTAKEAFKILKRLEQGERHALLAATVGKDILTARHHIKHGDCIELMKELPDGNFDVILSDPPYGMGADEFGDSGGMAAGAHFYRDDYSNWGELMGKALPEFRRITKPDAALYLFCDFDRFHELKQFVAEAGWLVHRTPLIWYKPNGSRAPWPDAGPQRKYEVILFAKRGEKKTNTLRGDVLEYPADENLGHPAQKPVALYRDLLARSAEPGQKVIDPFGGTGPILPAAHELKLYATAFEQDPAAYGIMVSRLKELT